MQYSQFIYVLKLIPRLCEKDNWTEYETKIVDSHFQYLSHMLEEGKLILAGKTEGLDENAFGIVIFEAISHNEALEMMNHDPGVAQGIMSATLYPYSVALMRHQKLSTK